MNAGEEIQAPLPRFRGHRVTGSLDIKRLLLELGHGRRTAFSDAYLGTWKPFHIATEFAEQTDASACLSSSAMDPDTVLRYESNQTGFFGFSSFVAKGIDEESNGQKDLFESHRIAHEIVRACNDYPTLFVVLLPAPGMFWGRENGVFLSILLTLLRDSPHTLILFSADDENDRWMDLGRIDWTGARHGKGEQIANCYESVELVRLIPGLVDDQQCTSLACDTEKLIPLGTSHFLVPIESRPLDQQDRLQYDKLAKQSEGTNWLVAYASVRGNAFFLDRDSISRFAWQAINLGSVDLGITYLTHLERTARSALDKAIVLAQLQGIYIRLWRFDKVAGCDLIQGTIPTNLMLFHLLAKGWGSVMVGDQMTADSCFRRVEGLLPPQKGDDKEYLYYLNIHALLDFRSGRIEEALGKEKTIEEALARGPSDAQLYYVNRINQARIYRRLEKYAESLAYYQQAFGTIVGIKRESDLVYCNVVLSRSFCDTGDYDRAFVCVLRGALHWLACENPELITKRLKVHIHYKEKDGPFESFFSNYLLNELQRLGALSNISPGVDSSHCFGFSSYDHTHQRQLAAPISANEICTFRFTKQPSPSIRAGDDYTCKLASWVSGVVTQLCHIPSEEKSGTLLIDNFGGNEMPGCRDEVYNYVASSMSDAIFWRGESVSCDAVEDWMALYLMSHPATQSIRFSGSSCVVSFKRYLPPLKVTGSCETGIMRLLENSGNRLPLRELASTSGSSAEDILSAIRLQLHPKKCVAFTTL